MHRQDARLFHQHRFQGSFKGVPGPPAGSADSEPAAFLEESSSPPTPFFSRPSLQEAFTLSLRLHLLPRAFHVVSEPPFSPLLYPQACGDTGRKLKGEASLKQSPGGVQEVMSRGVSGRLHPVFALEARLVLQVVSHLVPLGHWDSLRHSLSMTSCVLLTPLKV